MPPAAPYADTDAPPLPELSSSTASMPCWRSTESITVVPRSLKLLVGWNHSSLKCGRWAPHSFCTRGVQPSPMEIGRATSSGSDAR